jgi:hypothetical protein
VGLFDSGKAKAEHNFRFGTKCYKQLTGVVTASSKHNVQEWSDLGIVGVTREALALY